MDPAKAQGVRRQLHRLCHAGLEPLSFARSARDVLRRAVPFDASCWLTVDPATLLFTGGLFDYPPDMAPRLARNELLEDDVNKLAQLARRQVPVGVLSEATDGRPDRSARYRDILRPAGLVGELRAACRRDAHTWGASVLYREPGMPDFSTAEAAFVAEVSSLLGEGFRRSLIAASLAGDSVGCEGPGLVVLAEDGSIASMTPDAARWMEELDPVGAGVRNHPIPILFQVGYRARAVASGPVSAGRDAARLRVRTPSGRWLQVHASILDGPFAGLAAVILEPARPVEIAPLIAEAYGLSPRERQITQRVLQGGSTAEIARALHVSPLTVQDHLKSIFEKTGVNSRRELASRIFFEHHYPPTITASADGFAWRARS